MIARSRPTRNLRNLRIINLRSETNRARKFVSPCSNASIEHPNVVDIYDAGEFLGESYIVMELLEGEPLSDRLRIGPRLDVRDALEIGVQIARGVSAAHAAGVVHRDLKPENVFLSHDYGRSLVKVLDFGISKVDDYAGTAGDLLGTPFYMAPEQVTGGNVDERTDVHAVGILLFEMLTGRLPYLAEGVAGVLSAIASGRPADLRELRGDLSPAIVELVQNAIERDPANRPASTGLALALESIRASLPAPDI